MYEIQEQDIVDFSSIAPTAQYYLSLGNSLKEVLNIMLGKGIPSESTLSELNLYVQYSTSPSSVVVSPVVLDLAA